MDCLEHTNLPIGFVVCSIVLTTSISPSHKMSPEHALVAHVVPCTTVPPARPGLLQIVLEQFDHSKAAVIRPCFLISAPAKTALRAHREQGRPAPENVTSPYSTYGVKPSGVDGSAVATARTPRALPQQG